MVGENKALVISRTRNGSNTVLGRDLLQSKPGSVNTERQLTRGRGRRATGNARDVSGSSNIFFLSRQKMVVNDKCYTRFGGNGGDGKCFSFFAT